MDSKKPPIDFNTLSFKEKIIFFDNNFKNIKARNSKNIINKEQNKIKIKKEKEIININKKENITKDKKEKKNKDKDIIDEFEISDITEIENQNCYEIINDIDINLNLDPMWKSDLALNEVRIDLWEIIPITTPLKKSKKEYMKSLMSSIVYNGDMFKDKLSESSNKNIIIYDKLYNNFNIKQFKNFFVYMSYRNGLFNTKFLPGNKNNYTSDCGWGCMLRCCQMMLSRAFIKLNDDEKKFNFNEIIFLFYDKFIDINNMHINKNIFEIYKEILKRKSNVSEIIAPYSIYVLTLLGNCPNVFTSDHNMIRTIIKINKTLFNEKIIIMHFNGTVNKKKLIENFCEKVDKEKILNDNNEYIEYNNEKYNFIKSGIIFISLRLGLQKIESNFIDMIPKLFINLHNNIGFVSGKKKRAFYFVGINEKKLIFAEPHFNQNLETDEKNFPTYSFNDLYLINVKELSSELTVGVAIKDKNNLEIFFEDLLWFKQMNSEFIGFDDR